MLEKEKRRLFIGNDSVGDLYEMEVSLKSDYTLDFMLRRYSPVIRGEKERMERAKAYLEKMDIETKFGMCYFYDCSPKQLFNIIMTRDSNELWSDNRDIYLEEDIQGLDTCLKFRSCSCKMDNSVIMFSADISSLVHLVLTNLDSDIDKELYKKILSHMSSLNTQASNYVRSSVASSFGLSTETSKALKNLELEEEEEACK